MQGDLVWLLDPGHGGVINGVYQTPGKRSPVWPDGGQLYEGVFNRAIVRRIIAFCEKFGLKYYNIAPGEDDPHVATRANRANKVMCAVNEANPHASCVYISVHGNASRQPNTGTGWEVFTAAGSHLSKTIAAVFYRKAEAMFSDRFLMRRGWDDDFPSKNGRFTVLTRTAMPSILTENFFYDNVNDYEFMVTDRGRAEIAWMHCLSMLEWQNRHETDRHWLTYDVAGPVGDMYDMLIDDPGEMPVTNCHYLKT